MTSRSADWYVGAPEASAARARICSDLPSRHAQAAITNGLKIRPEDLIANGNASTPAPNAQFATFAMDPNSGPVP